MPVYEYKCQACEGAFEQLVRSMDGDADMTCPECGSKKVERQLSVFAARAGNAHGSGSIPMPEACQGCGGGAGGSCPLGRE